MKLLYLHQYFNTPAAAGSTRSYEMARRLVAAGHEVHIVTTDRSTATRRRGWHETEEAGIRVHWLPIDYDNRMSYSERLRPFLAYAMQAGRRARSIGGDVVLATSTPLTVALPGLHAAAGLRAPFVFEVRDLWPEVPIAMGALGPGIPTFLARRLELAAYRSAADIIALSPGMRDGVLRSGVSAERVHVIPNGSDLEVFRADPELGASFRRRHPFLADRPMVLYPGTIGKVNGVEYLAQLAAKTASMAPNVCFVVIGTGAEEDRVRAEAYDLGVLDTNFFMLPRIPKAEMPAAFAAASIAASVVIDLKVLESNSANKVFDAFAAGRPVAINYGGWQASLLEGSGAGIRLPYDDLEHAARILTRTLADSSWLKQAGGEARRLAETRFNRDILARELEAVLLGALERGPTHSYGRLARSVL